MVYSFLLRALFRALYGPPAAAEVPPDQEGAGLILAADGVGGLDLMATGLQHVVPPAGLPHAVQVVRWGHGLGRWIADLTRVSRHEAQAEVIVAAAESFHEQRPGSPVYLVGKSGGTGIVVRALEKLPAESVDTAVLIAPAISPRYDLTQALRAVKRELVVFWSPLDVFILGLGTWIFGTIDRVHTPSAGLVGFRPPERMDELQQEQYAKLRQVRWHPRMAKTGYLGGHVGPDSPVFLRKYVVPLLMSQEAQPNESGYQASPAQGR